MHVRCFKDTMAQWKGFHARALVAKTLAGGYVLTAAALWPSACRLITYLCAGNSAAAAAAAAAASGRGRHLLDWGWGHRGSHVHNDRGRHHDVHHGRGAWFGGWRNGHGRDHDGKDTASPSSAAIPCTQLTQLSMCCSES